MTHIEKESKMVDRMPDRRYAHFRDDQIVFLVTHNQEKIAPEELATLKRSVDATLGAYLRDDLKMTQEPNSPTVEIKWLDSQVFSFPQPTSLELDQLEGILNDMEAYKPGFARSNYRPKILDPEDQSKRGFSILIGNMMFTESNEHLQNFQKSFDPSKLIGAIKKVRENLKDPNMFNGVMVVKHVSPNWLIGNSSQGGSTGGPGGLPEPFKGTDEAGAMKAKFSIQDKLVPLGLYGTGENVDVAILDTAPCPHELVIAHKEGTKKNNPLLQTLLGPDGKLHVYWATYDQLLRMYNTSFNNHDYRMSDHGIFAAGIIHSIVPDATIHLIEVLNPLGVGDLLTLAEGFHKVFYEIYQKAGQKRRLVVNCSLMLVSPIVDEHRYADDRKEPAKDKEPADDVRDVDFEQEVYDLLMGDPDILLEINDLCRLLFAAGRQVVAAAGNDWVNGKARRRRRSQSIGKRPEAPVARYPAGFESVVGVGALPRDSRIGPDKHKASSYSNLGDKPEGDAIMTLGGEEGEENGVLGLYLSNMFPKRERISQNDRNYITMYPRRFNKDEAKTEDNYWAWWSGTSFAAPILTGTIAAVLSSKDQLGNYKVANTQKAIHELYTTGAISDGANPGAEATEAGEDVMVVTQEHPLPSSP